MIPPPTKPLAIDLYCGLGGWAEGFLAEGYNVIGFDIETPRLWNWRVSGLAGAAKRFNSPRFAIQKCRCDRRIAAVPSLQLPSHAHGNWQSHCPPPTTNCSWRASGSNAKHQKPLGGTFR